MYSDRAHPGPRMRSEVHSHSTMGEEGICYPSDTTQTTRHFQRTMPKGNLPIASIEIWQTLKARGNRKGQVA